MRSARATENNPTTQSRKPELQIRGLVDISSLGLSLGRPILKLKALLEGDGNQIVGRSTIGTKEVPFRLGFGVLVRG